MVVVVGIRFDVWTVTLGSSGDDCRTLGFTICW